MLNKILIPLDGSALAERALIPGLQLARHAGAPIILLRSVSPERIAASEAYLLTVYNPTGLNQPVEQAHKEAAAYLKVVQSHNAGPDLKLIADMRDGDPAESIVDAAEAAPADLIVMSSHGYSGVTRWMLGSVAERVLHEAPCPVLVVRSSKPIRHMLITLDGSPLSEQVLGMAIHVAKSLQCRVTLLRAIQPVTLVDMESLEKIEAGLGRSYQEEMHQAAEDYLTPFATKHRSFLPELNTIVMHGPAAQSILDYAALHDVDLIAMSTHGRTGLKRWVYGSVTEKVLHAPGNYSMLVVRPEESGLN